MVKLVIKVKTVQKAMRTIPCLQGMEIEDNRHASNVAVIPLYGNTPYTNHTCPVHKNCHKSTSWLYDTDEYVENRWQMIIISYHNYMV